MVIKIDRVLHPYMGKSKVKPFEEHAKRYDEWFERHKQAYESELLALRELIPETRKDIEIGVGSGRFAAPLSLQFGVEPSIKMAEIAQKRGIDVVLGIAEALPFEDCIFDLALMVTTICFINDISMAFREAYRVLKSH
jgi:ubiquinone/menaquinone biosynthesis C-methylase UbiE